MSAYEKSETKEKPILEPPLSNDQLTGEDLAPDGGWGWMVAAGMTVVNIMSFAQGTSFGLIYGDFLEATGNGGSALTFINLVFIISFSFSGLICNELLKTFNIKPVGVIGATIYAIANTVTCFTPNIYYLATCYFIQGMGVGIMATICNVSFNSYFVKLRTKVMAATQVITGLGPIMYPLFIEHLLSAYGFRGTLALLGGMSFNVIVSLYVMDPVEKHYKKPKITPRINGEKEEQEKKLKNRHSNILIGGGKIDTIRRHSMDAAESWEKNRSVQSLNDETEQEKPLLTEALKISHRSQTCSHPGLDIETGFRSRPGKGSNRDIPLNRLSMMAATSVTSISGVTAFGPILDAEVPVANRKKRSIRKILADFFEVSLLRDGVYLNMGIGSSMVLMCDLLFCNFLPMILAQEGYTKTEAALTLTVAAIAELLSKILFMVFAMFFKTKARHIYLGAAYLLFFTRIAFFFCNSLMSTLVVNTLSGMARSWYMVAQSLIIAEHFSIDKFSAAWGLYAVINGSLSVILFPLIGLVKDLTQSYVVTQYMLLGGLLTCLIPWTIEILVYEIFPRGKTTETTNGK